jgi:hypothetical protein
VLSYLHTRAFIYWFSSAIYVLCSSFPHWKLMLLSLHLVRAEILVRPFERVYRNNLCNNPGPTNIGGPSTATSRSSPPPSLVEFLPSARIEPCSKCLIKLFIQTAYSYYILSYLCVSLIFSASLLFICWKQDGATLMHYAVQTASVPTIKVLLLYNVDINLPDNVWSIGPILSLCTYYSIVEQCLRT